MQVVSVFMINYFSAKPWMQVFPTIRCCLISGTSTVRDLRTHFTEGFESQTDDFGVLIRYRNPKLPAILTYQTKEYHVGRLEPQVSCSRSAFLTTQTLMLLKT